MINKDEADVRLDLMDRFHQHNDEDVPVYLARLDVYAKWIMSGTVPEDPKQKIDQSPDLVDDPS